MKSGSYPDSELTTPDNLINNAPFSYSIVDSNLRIVLIGPRIMEAFSGKTRDEIIGQSITSFYPSITHDLKAVLDFVFTNGKSHVVEVKKKRPTGKERLYIACYYPIKNSGGETKFVLIFMHDITNRSIAVYDATYQTKMLHNIIENLPEYFCMVNRDGYLLRWNKNFEKLTGYSTIELSKLRVIDLVESPEPELFWQQFEKLFHVGKGVSKNTIIRKDGKKIPQITTGVIEEIDGQPCCLFLALDTTRLVTEGHVNLLLLKGIEKVKKRLEMENLYLKEEIALKHNHAEIVGESPAIRRVLRQVEQVAKTDSTVLLLGETGTGKELVAHSIHKLSTRSKNAIVRVNCAALPGHLIENELFGHERGAYTGAMNQQIGRFEIASGSSIFLDEIGELSLDLQSKLLRVLQEGKFERLGGTKTINTDVRVIAATNRNLLNEVENGNFRKDLYYRLNVFPINVPPLRERIEDIPLLVNLFVKEFSLKMGKTIKQIPPHVMKKLQWYDWQGNVRELRNIIERAMIVSNGPILKVESLQVVGNPRNKVLTLAELERNYILEILEQTAWRIRGNGGAAELLGLKPTTLDSKMKKLMIKRPSF